jgi:A/G-specific adenine glycosylase
MMELGATICTPRSPKCLLCPVRAHCEAQAAGVQEMIPAPKKSQLNPLLRRDVLCIERDGRWLIEQRPPTGRWAAMWQFVTIEAGSAAREHGLRRGKRLGTVAHQLSHRRYEFRVFKGGLLNGTWQREGRQLAWVTLQELAIHPLPRPHLKIAALLANAKTHP